MHISKILKKIIFASQVPLFRPCAPSIVSRGFSTMTKENEIEHSGSYIQNRTTFEKGT